MISLALRSGLVMVHKNRGPFLAILLAILASQQLFAANQEKEGEDFITAEKIKQPLEIFPKWVASNTTKTGEKDQTWVSMVLVHQIQDTKFKALQFFKVRNGNKVGADVPPLYAVVNEQSLEKNKNEKGEDVKAPARIVLTLGLMELYRRNDVIKVSKINFSPWNDKLLKIELRNDENNVTKIKSWTDKGNYFYLEKDQGDLVSMNIGELKAAPKSTKKSGNLENDIIGEEP